MSRFKGISRDVRRCGYALAEMSRAEFAALGRRLGVAVSVRPNGPLVDVLKPTAQSAAAPRSLSAIHGLEDFPFHTDGAHHALPPRYVLLRLDDGATSTTPTQIADGRLAIGRSRAATALSREVWLVRPGRARAFLAPILDVRRDMIRFDAGCMTEPAGTRLIGRSLLQERLRQGLVEEIAWSPGRTLVLDNWRMLHARPAITDDQSSRVLLRRLIA